MKCQLCLLDKPLIKKSHIIPNFLYKGMFGKQHKLINVNIDNVGDKKIMQTGFNESNILCAKCDNEIIGRLERYASNAIYMKESRKYAIKKKYVQETELHPAYIRCYGLDYTFTKLFFLSILWRSHISKIPFFEDIILDNDTAEKIRTMILKNNPGEEAEFEVILVNINVSESRFTQSLMQPRAIHDNGTYFVFHINEVMYHFNIDSPNKDTLFDKGIIKKDGILDIVVISEHLGESYFDSFLGRKIIRKSKF